MLGCSLDVRPYVYWILFVNLEGNERFMLKVFLKYIYNWLRRKPWDAIGKWLHTLHGYIEGNPAL